MSRPRDPGLDQRVIDATVLVLAATGRAGFTLTEVAAAAGVGKASIYRRWPSDRELLRGVMSQLGVAAGFDFGDPAESSTRDDVLKLLTAACTGQRAMAEVALAPDCGMDTAIRKAYRDGPQTRLIAAVGHLGARALQRAEDIRPSLDRIFAAVTLLQWGIALNGNSPDPATIEHVIDTVVMPVVDRAPVSA